MDVGVCSIEGNLAYEGESYMGTRGDDRAVVVLVIVTQEKERRKNEEKNMNICWC